MVKYMDKKKILFGLEVAKVVAKQSTSVHRRVGAVILDKEGHIVSTGYNGAIKNEPHESVVGCIREKYKKIGLIQSGEFFSSCSELHAEMNAIINAAYLGIQTAGKVLVCTALPCIWCARMIVQAGLSEVYYHQDYPSNAVGLLKEHVKLEKIV